MVLEKNTIRNDSRHYGIELLRIVAMFMVLFLHILGNGGILFELEPLSPHGIVAWFFEMATFSAINCYGIISGYVGVNSRCKYSNLVLLWLQVALYSVGITLVYRFRYPLMVTGKDVSNAFFPVTNSLYWYVTAYVGMYLLMPVLNNGIKSFTKNQFKAVLILLFTALSVLPMIFDKDIFSTLWGYSTLWLCFLYMVGGYIKLHGFFKNSLPFAISLYAVTVLLSWGIKLWEEHVSTAGKYADLATGMVAQYTSPTVFLSGVGLFVIFLNIHPKGFAKKIIALFSPCAFGVYIIHAHPFLWDRLITYRYADYINHTPLVMMLLVLLTAFCMFSLLSLVDMVRLWVFRLLRLKPLLEKIENKLLGDLWK